MVKNSLILIGVLLFLFVSCDNRTFERKMECIKAIGDTNPELAMKMLDSLKKQDIESNVYLGKNVRCWIYDLGISCIFNLCRIVQ